MTAFARVVVGIGGSDRALDALAFAQRLVDPGMQIGAASEGVVDVLFTGSRGYGPVHRAFAGSVSEAILLQATQPVVVTPRGGPVPSTDTAEPARASA